ncbi:hypothetical protein C0991_005485, partial [Blastosporella zonata]
ITITGGGSLAPTATQLVTFPGSYSNTDPGLTLNVYTNNAQTQMDLYGAPALRVNGGAELDVHLKTQLLIRAYQVRGHHIAKLDPLGIMDPDLANMQPQELELSRYGFTDRDLDHEITLSPGILPHFATEDWKTMKLREIISLCKCIYCGAVGIQYVHIPDKEQCDWIREHVETPNLWNYTVEEKRMILDRLIWSESFEKFMASKVPQRETFRS